MHPRNRAAGAARIRGLGLALPGHLGGGQAADRAVHGRALRVGRPLDRRLGLLGLRVVRDARHLRHRLAGRHLGRLGHGLDLQLLRALPGVLGRLGGGLQLGVRQRHREARRHHHLPELAGRDGPRRNRRRGRHGLPRLARGLRNRQLPLRLHVGHQRRARQGLQLLRRLPRPHRGRLRDHGQVVRRREGHGRQRAVLARGGRLRRVPRRRAGGHHHHRRGRPRLHIRQAPERLLHREGDRGAGRIRARRPHLPGHGLRIRRRGGDGRAARDRHPHRREVRRRHGGAARRRATPRSTGRSTRRATPTTAARRPSRARRATAP